MCVCVWGGGGEKEIIYCFFSVQSEGSSQPSYTGTPTKRLSVEVTRIATPPKMSPLPQLKTEGESEEERDGGRGKEREGGLRRSPRKNLKRERPKENETERAKESEENSKLVCGEKTRKCAQKTKKAKSEATEKAEDQKPRERVMRTKPSTARKAIKYLDESEDEDTEKSRETSNPAKAAKKQPEDKEAGVEKKGGGRRVEKMAPKPNESKDEPAGKGGREGKKKEQAVFMSGGSSTLACVSPQKTGASPRKQQTPDREGYLVKQPGLTFDKDKSASPVKTPKKTSTETRREPAGVQTPVKQVSTPTKPVSKSPAERVSTPVKPVSKPQPLPAKAATPASGPRPGGGTTPGTTPKVSRGSSYRNYMNRGGPKAPGSKVVPEGEENCFEGLTFVITGVLESLEREEAADIVKRFV